MAKKESTKTTIRRIKATDDKPKKVVGAKAKTTKKSAVNPAKTKQAARIEKSTAAKKSHRNPLTALGGYFKGAWHELKLVRWPTRSATWSMTLAVLVFTLIFAGIILLLDAGFNWAFEQLLKR